jgi:hypothetical protein
VVVEVVLHLLEKHVSMVLRHVQTITVFQLVLLLEFLLHSVTVLMLQVLLCVKTNQSLVLVQVVEVVDEAVVEVVDDLLVFVEMVFLNQEKSVT